MKRALIIGARGQDGTLLTQHLVACGRVVVGLDRGTMDRSDGGATNAVDLLDAGAIAGLVGDFAPDEVYYLAAFHHSSQSSELLAPTTIWEQSFDVHVHGLLKMLEAVRTRAPRARLFYAASSLVFGRPEQSPQTESLPLAPRCVYGITKAAGVQSCRFYREQYSLFTAVGILYNHESHLRSESFLSRKIVRAAVRIRQGLQRDLVLGDLSAQTDWGYAPDYVDAMRRILESDRPDDFIVASGRLHRVRDWVEGAFGAVGLRWQDYVREDPSLITRNKHVLVGDSSKLRKLTGWQPATSFEQMVVNMVRMEGDA
jgi:GDPmannose 4,6-dehydratase